MAGLDAHGAALILGYTLGFKDARTHSENILVRAVNEVRVAFGAKPANDVDAVMTKVEGKN